MPKKNKKKHSEQNIDRLIVAQASDHSAWGKSIRIRKKKIDLIPDEFDSYEEAAEFWDKHDTTNYLQSSRPIPAPIRFSKNRSAPRRRK